MMLHADAPDPGPAQTARRAADASRSRSDGDIMDEIHGVFHDIQRLQADNELRMKVSEGKKIDSKFFVDEFARLARAKADRVAMELVAEEEKGEQRGRARTDRRSVAAVPSLVDVAETLSQFLNRNPIPRSYRSIVLKGTNDDAFESPYDGLVDWSKIYLLKLDKKDEHAPDVCLGGINVMFPPAVRSSTGANRIDGAGPLCKEAASGIELRLSDGTSWSVPHWPVSSRHVRFYDGVVPRSHDWFHMQVPCAPGDWTARLGERRLEHTDPERASVMFTDMLYVRGAVWRLDLICVKAFIDQAHKDLLVMYEELHRRRHETRKLMDDLEETLIVKIDDLEDAVRHCEDHAKLLRHLCRWNNSLWTTWVHMFIPESSRVDPATIWLEADDPNVRVYWVRERFVADGGIFVLNDDGGLVLPEVQTAVDSEAGARACDQDGRAAASAPPAMEPPSAMEREGEEGRDEVLVDADKVLVDADGELLPLTWLVGCKVLFRCDVEFHRPYHTDSERRVFDFVRQKMIFCQVHRVLTVGRHVRPPPHAMRLVLMVPTSALVERGFQGTEDIPARLPSDRLNTSGAASHRSDLGLVSHVLVREEPRRDDGRRARVRCVHVPDMQYFCVDIPDVSGGKSGAAPACTISRYFDRVVAQTNRSSISRMHMLFWLNIGCEQLIYARVTSSPGGVARWLEPYDPRWTSAARDLSLGLDSIFMTGDHARFHADLLTTARACVVEHFERQRKNGSTSRFDKDLSLQDEARSVAMMSVDALGRHCDHDRYLSAAEQIMVMRRMCSVLGSRMAIGYVLVPLRGAQEDTCPHTYEAKWIVEGHDDDDAPGDPKDDEHGMPSVFVLNCMNRRHPHSIGSVANETPDQPLPVVKDRHVNPLAWLLLQHICDVGRNYRLNAAAGKRLQDETPVSVTPLEDAFARMYVASWLRVRGCSSADVLEASDHASHMEEEERELYCEELVQAMDDAGPNFGTMAMMSNYDATGGPSGIKIFHRRKRAHFETEEQWREVNGLTMDHVADTIGVDSGVEDEKYQGGRTMTKLSVERDVLVHITRCLEAPDEDIFEEMRCLDLDAPLDVPGHRPDGSNTAEDDAWLRHTDKVRHTLQKVCFGHGGLVDTVFPFVRMCSNCGTLFLTRSDPGKAGEGDSGLALNMPWHERRNWSGYPPSKGVQQHDETYFGPTNKKHSAVEMNAFPSTCKTYHPIEFCSAACQCEFHKVTPEDMTPAPRRLTAAWLARKHEKDMLPIAGMNDEMVTSLMAKLNAVRRSGWRELPPPLVDHYTQVSLRLATRDQQRRAHPNPPPAGLALWDTAPQSLKAAQALMDLVEKEGYAAKPPPEAACPPFSAAKLDERKVLASVEQSMEGTTLAVRTTRDFAGAFGRCLSLPSEARWHEEQEIRMVMSHYLSVCYPDPNDAAREEPGREARPPVHEAAAGGAPNPARRPERTRLDAEREARAERKRVERELKAQRERENETRAAKERARGACELFVRLHARRKAERRERELRAEEQRQLDQQKRAEREEREQQRLEAARKRDEELAKRCNSAASTWESDDPSLTLEEHAHRTAHHNRPKEAIARDFADRQAKEHEAKVKRRKDRAGRRKEDKEKLKGMQEAEKEQEIPGAPTVSTFLDRATVVRPKVKKSVAALSVEAVPADGAGYVVVEGAAMPSRPEKKRQPGKARCACMD